MARNIKGITIQLNGDATGLNNALQSVNQNIRKTQSDLKDVNRLLKLDPGNTDLLAQKQRLLANAINETKQKLETLKTAQQQAAQQLAAGKIGQDQYDALQREIAETEQKLKSFNSESDATEKQLREMGDAAGDAAQDTGKLDISFKSMIQNAAINLAVDGLKALANSAKEAAKYVLDVGSSFEAGMSKVGAVSGASAADMEKLSAKAKEMGATTKFSASEAAEAMNYMAMAGWKTEDMLQGVEGIMNLAAASGEELATTSDIVTDALTAFGKTAEDSGRLADIMAAASSNANTNVSMMGETFKYAAPVAGALGASMEDTAIAVGLMANSGIKASQAGTALRTGLSNLAKPTKQMKEWMDKYNISLVENEDGSVNLRETMIQLREKMGQLSETEQAAAASAIFGKNAMSGWMAIINSSDSDFDKLTQAIDNSEGAAQKMAETMGDNLQGKITIFQSALEGLGIALYEKVSGPLQDVVEVATNALSGITSALQNNKAKDYLDDFYESVKAANEETARSIENAKKTVDDAKSKVGVLAGFEKQFIDIMTECDNFRGSLDELGGKSEQVGYLQKAFDDTTDSIRDTYVITDEFTKSKIDAMVEELSGSVDGLSEAWDSQTGTLSASKKELKEWFSIAKEVAMYEALQDSIKEVTKAYGTAAYEQTRAESAQKAANKALEDYYETLGMTEDQIIAHASHLSAEQKLLDPIYQGYLDLKGAVADTNTEYENATKNMEAAEEEYTTMQGVMNETAEKLTALGVLTEEEAEANEDAADSIDKKEKSYRGANATFATALDAEKAIRKATEGTVKIVNESSEATEKNTEATGRNAEANDEARRSVVERRIAEKDAAVTYEESADATEKAVEAAHKAADAQRTLRDALTEARDDMRKAFEDIKKSAEDAFKVNPFDQWSQDAEKGMLAFEEAMKSQRDGLLRYKDNLTTVKDNLGQTAPEFVQYLEDMGQGGAQLVAEFADAFRTGNADVVYRLMDEYKQALDIQDDVTGILEQDKLALLLGLEALTPEMVAAWEDLGYAFDEGKAVIEAKGGELSQSTTDSFWAAVDAAKAVGAEVPAGLAESIRNSEDPMLAIQEATTVINESLRGRGLEMLAAAQELGLQIPAGIVATLQDKEATGDQLQAAVGQLAETIKTKKSDFETAGTEAGQGMADSTAAGIEGKSADVTASTESVLNTAKEAAALNVGLFRMIGSSGMESYKSGMLDKEEDVKTAAVGIVSRAKEVAQLYADRVFEAMGESATTKLSEGMGNAISTIDSEMAEFVNNMNGYASTFAGAIEQMKASTNFYWNLPHLDMPHPWVRGRFSVDPPEVPYFGIDWYAKAMQNGMILNKPTIFGMQGNRFLAGGEAGSETVVGTNSLMEMIKNAVSQGGTSFGDINIAVTSPVTDARTLAKELEVEISKNIIRRSGRF